MLRADLCDHNDAYIVVKGTIDLLADAVNENDKDEKNVVLKNNVWLRSWISKINSILIDNVEDLDMDMPTYSMISGSLWNYYRYKIDNVNNNALDGKSFRYKSKIAGITPARPGNEGDANWPAVPTLNVEVSIPLKYLSKLLKILTSSLINCGTELDLSWTQDWILIEQHNNITEVNFSCYSVYKW